MRYRGSSESSLLVTVAVLLALLAGCGSIEGKLIAYDSVVTHIRAAATALREAPGVRVHGTVRDSRGQNVAIDVRLNGAGEGAGKVQRKGTVGDVLLVDSATYVRAATAWWAPDNRAESYDRFWVKVAASTVGLDFAATLRPAALGTLIEDNFGSLPIEDQPPVQKINGVAAQKIQTSNGAFWLSAAKPYRVMRVEGTMLTDPDNRPAAVMVSITSPPATAQIARDVALTLPQLRRGSYDARRSLQFDGTLRSACDAAGCTVTGRIRNTATDTPVAAMLNGKVSSGSTVLGRCRSGQAPIAAASATTVTCRVSTAAWRAFYATATAPGTRRATTSYQVSANASALGPAPEAVACLRGANGCQTPTMNNAEVVKTFDRSAPSWYQRSTTDSDRPDWRNMIRTAAAGKDRVPWSADGVPTVAYLSAAKGRPFVAQFDRGSGTLVSAFGPDDAETAALRQAIAGTSSSR